MSSELEKTNEELLISLMSELSINSESTTSSEPESNILNLKYTATDLHTIDADYFKVFSKNQVTIDTKGAAADDADHTQDDHADGRINHTLVDGVCIKCLDRRVSNNAADIKDLRSIIGDSGGTAKIDNTTIDTLMMPNSALKFLYFEPNPQTISSLTLKFNQALYDENPDGIFRTTMIVNGSSLEAESTYKFKIGTEFEFNIRVKPNYVYMYDITWVGPMYTFLLDMVTKKSED